MTPITARELGGAYAAAFLVALLTILADGAGLLGGGPVPYGNYGHCDPWYYFGLILSPDSGAFLAPDTRVIGRPLFFAPIHALKSLLPGLDANVLSYLFFVPITIAALYVGLRAMFGRVSSAASALLIGSSPLLIGIASTTYVTVASAAYGNVMIACLMWGGRLTKRRAVASDVLFAVAGSFFVFAANANLISIKFNLMYVLFAVPVHLLSKDRASHRPVAIVVARAAGLFLIGSTVGAALTLLLSYSVGLGLFTPYNQVADALRGIGEWRYEGWFRETMAFCLIGLAVVLCANALHRVRGVADLDARRVQLLVTVVIATCVFNLYAALWSGDPNLSHDYFYFLILPCVALAFCAAFAGHMEKAGPVSVIGLAITVVVLNLLLVSNLELRELLNRKQHVAPYPLVGALAIFLFLARNRVWDRRTVVAGVAMVAASLLAANGNYYRGYHGASRVEEQAIARTTEEAVVFIHENVVVKPIVWIAKGDNSRLDLPIFRSLVRCRFEPSFPDELPDAKLHRQPAFASGQTLIVIDGTATPVNGIAQALATHGFGFEPVASRYFQRSDRDGAGVQVTIGQLR